jgi:hypothetical protein
VLFRSIGTEHILLALVREGGAAARMLAALEVDLSKIPDEVLADLAGPRRRRRSPSAVPEGLDPGIRSYVEVLVGAGVETFESCQGGEGHAFPEPTVRFHGQREEGFRAFAVAQQHALPVFAVRRVWDVIDGELTGPHWEMTFRTAVSG